MSNPSPHAQSGDADCPQIFEVYRGWYVVASCVVMMCVATGPIYYSYGIFTAPFTETFGAPRTLIALGLTLTLIVGGIASWPLGWVADRMPIKPLVLLGIAGTALGLLLVSFAGAMWQIILVYGTLIATADTMMGMLAVNLLLARWFERRRGLALGIGAMGASLGAIIFPPFVAFLVEQYGWRTAYQVLAGITLLVALPIALFGDIPKGGLPKIEQLLIARPFSAHKTPMGFMKVREFWILTVAVGLLGAVNTGVVISIVPFAIAEGAQPVDAAALVSILGGFALAGKLCIGAIADRIDLRRALQLAVALCLCSMAVLGMSKASYGVWAASVAVLGLSMGGQLPLWGAISARLFGMEIYGSVLGLSRAAMMPITFALPLMAGVIFDLTNGYDRVWQAYAATSALVLLFTLTMRPFTHAAGPVGDRATSNSNRAVDRNETAPEAN